MRFFVPFLIVLLAFSVATAEPHIVCGGNKFQKFNTYWNVKAEKAYIDGRNCIKLQLGGVSDKKGGALQFYSVKASPGSEYDAVTILYKGDGGTGKFVLYLRDKDKNSWTWKATPWQPSSWLPCYNNSWYKKVLLLKDFVHTGSLKGKASKLEAQNIVNIQIGTGLHLKEPSKKYAEIYIGQIAFEKGAKEKNYPAKSTKKKVSKKIITSVPLEKHVLQETKVSSYALPKWVNWDIKQHFQKNTRSRSYICLNNYWQFQPVAASKVELLLKNNGNLPTVPGVPAKGGVWNYVKVPGRWDGNGYRLLDAQRKEVLKIDACAPADYAQGWMRRGFYAPKSWKGKKVSLQFNCICENAQIFINGVPCGLFTKTAHIEIDDKLLYGKNNEIALLVQNPSLPVKPSHRKYREFATMKLGTRWWYRWHDGIGLTEDVWLSVMPKGIAAKDLRIIPAVSKGTLAAGVNLTNNTAKTCKLYASAQVKDKDNTVLTIPATAFNLDPGKTVKAVISAPWKNPVCWTPCNPKQYTMVFTLKDASGKVIDEMRDTFGYRELTTRGGDFFLNGTKIRLQFRSDQFHYAGLEEGELRKMLTEFKSMHFNGLILESMNERTVKLCNEMGMMVALRHVMPPLVRNGTYLPGVPSRGFPYEVYLAPGLAQGKEKLEQAITRIVRKFRNDPSLVIWMVNPLLCWTREWINPNLLDAELPVNDLIRATMLEQKFLNQLDPTRLIIQSMSGSVGNVISANPYPTFENQPDEWSDWPMKWSARKKKPMILEEISLPYKYTFTNWHKESKRRDTYWKEKHQMYYEQGARYFGDAIYESAKNSKMKDIYWNFLGNRKVKNQDNSSYIEINPAAEQTAAYWVERCRRMWRIYDISGVWMFDESGLYFDNGNCPVKDLPAAADITTPGSKRDYAASMDYSRRNKIYDVTKRIQQPFIAYLGGRPERVSSLEHAWYPGDIVSKQMLFSNDALDSCSAKGLWKIIQLDNNKVVASGKWNGVLKPGDIRRVPFKWKVPEVSKRTGFQIKFEASSRKTVCEDTLDMQVFPRKVTKFTKRIYLYDEKGVTRKLLKKMNVPFTENIPGIENDSVLVVGRESFTDSFIAKAQKLKLAEKLNNGTTMLIMAQTTAGVLKDYLEERRSRHLFFKDNNHAVAKGLRPEDIHHWRGESDLLEAYPSKGSAVRNQRFMRWGMEGVVSSFVMDKPCRGRFNIIIDGDADLSRAALLEYMTGKGRVIFCQLDISSRYGTDPAATLLTDNLFKYLEQKKSCPVVSAGYSGNGKALKDLGFILNTCTDLNINEQKVLVVTADNRISAELIRKFAENGGTVLCVGADAGMIAGLQLPFKLKFSRKKTRLADYPADSELLRGLGNSDFFFNPPASLNVITEAPNAAEHRSEVFTSVPFGKGYYLFLTLKPSDFTEKNLQAKAERIISTVLCRLGVPARSQVNFHKDRGDIILSGRKVSFNIDPQSKGLKKQWQSFGLDDSKWRKIELGAYWEDEGVNDKNPYYKPGVACAYDGDAWYRIPVIIPKSWKGRKLYFEADRIDDYDHTYFNGQLIGKTGEETVEYWKAKRLYAIPEKSIRYGKKNVIAIYVRDLRGNGGPYGNIRIGGKHPQKSTGIFYKRPTRIIMDFDPNSWRQW